MGLWRVLSDLEEDGYETEWGLYSAEETGAPHQRIRCFVLARLGNPASLRPRGGSENCAREQSEVLGERLESDELADPASREPRQPQAWNGGQDIGGGSEDTQWPARPGEEQYEWEEPRVTEIESFVRGATNGTQHRVDRLRLLGNGVVPQTAELAWTTLWKELISRSPQEK